MLDFFQISRRQVKKNVIEIFPTFVVRSNSSDLMIRGRDFYAVWDEEKKMWSKDEQSVIDQVDREVEKEYIRLTDMARKEPELADITYIPKYMWNSDSGVIDKWHRYVQKQCRDQYHQLDEKVMFANSRFSKRDYSSRRMSYALENGDISAYDELMSVLYDSEERDKLEWAIGAIASGDSRKIQKFIFLYGGGGTGKSTFLDIVKWLFDGYYCTFRAQELGDSGSSFALESFKDNPLVGIDAEADISKLNDNTKLNSIVAHEQMEINEKFKSKYTAKFNTFIFMGSNNMVNITDAKSGMIRRVIDVTPTGKLLEFARYTELMERIKENELGAIAKHCLDRYNELGINYYSKYVPTRMIEGTNEFYNFMLEHYWEFRQYDRLSLGFIWAEYGKYCEEANVPYKMTRRKVRTELMEYFDDYQEDVYENGKHERSIFSGLKESKFRSLKKDPLVAIPNKNDAWLKLKDHTEFQKNVLDEIFADCPAQYAVGEGSEKPSTSWDNVKKTLKDLDTTKVHYVRPPDPSYISVDFDIKDENGNKSLGKNLEAAAEWPPTYAEVSKGGQGLHLEYIYTGDAEKLARQYDEDIEIKVFTGKSSLRRRLSKCNDLPIAKIGDGLPTRKEVRMLNPDTIKSEKVLRRFIMKCLEKDHHGATAPEVNYIYAKLEEVYSSGLHYDVSDLKPSVLAFAANSTHQAQKCIAKVGKMKFKSEEPSSPVDYETDAIVFVDVEVFSNLFVVCYKFSGEKAIGLVNPDPDDIRKLCRYRLIGFNNRKYDNHILYARMQGYSNEQLYNLSQKIIEGNRNAFFGEAYNLSYTDIYDFASSGNKMSLKKWEIKLGIHHLELGLPWDQPVAEELWDKVVEYCCNDVDATEALFNCDPIHADFVAREILADLAGGTPNDTTNQLTAKIIFGDAKNPQKEFVYTDLSGMFPGYEFNKFGIDTERYTGKIVNGKSIYRGIDPSEGGRVYAEPGMYYNVALLDIASMHPSSIENLNLFGPYTKNFSDIKLARLYIKHKEYNKAKELFDGKLAKYLDDPAMAKSLSNALKTAINSVYGLTSASFDNKFRDPRNVDNIVAKRGALFMIELQLTLQNKGVRVAHVKTDSIKIPEANQEIIDFVMEFGKKYGYTFEHEATYEKLCLVNESVYIAKDKADGHWTATGAQFQVPYLFKKLFSHEPISFEDMCETKSVTSALYLDFNEGLPEEDHNYAFVGRVGLFCPMQPGAGGGLLLREKDGKYNSATGAKGYRWMEAEMVRNLGLEDKIDRSYYEKMVDDAIETIEKFGDFEMFVSDDPVSELPF